MPRQNMTQSLACRMTCPILLCLMLCGACCAPRVETVVLTPPENLMQPTPHPALPEALMHTDNVREYAKAATLAIVRYGEALDMSNADKAAITDWSKTVNGAEIGK